MKMVNLDPTTSVEVTDGGPVRLFTLTFSLSTVPLEGNTLDTPVPRVHGCQYLLHPRVNF